MESITHENVQLFFKKEKNWCRRHAISLYNVLYMYYYNTWMYCIILHTCTSVVISFRSKLLRSKVIRAFLFAKPNIAENTLSICTCTQSSEKFEQTFIFKLASREIQLRIVAIFDWKKYKVNVWVNGNIIFADFQENNTQTPLCFALEQDGFKETLKYYIWLRPFI